MTLNRRAIVASIATLMALGVATVWLSRRSAPASRGAGAGAAPSTPRDPRPELVLQTGHLDRVSSVTFSPDSRLLASASHDGTVKVWDVDNRRELRSFATPDTMPPDVSFSRDGLWLTATGIRFRAWAVSSGQSRDPAIQPKWMAGSANGQWLAGEGQPGVRVSQHVGGDPGQWLPRSLPAADLTLHFSRDDRWLAVEEKSFFGRATTHDDMADVAKVRAFAASDNVEETIQIWEVNTWRRVLTISGRRPVNAEPVFSADGRWLAVIGEGRRLVDVWDVAQARKLRTLIAPARLSVVTFSPDSRVVAAAADDYLDTLRDVEQQVGLVREDASVPVGSLVLWDLAEEAAPRTIAAGAGITALAFSPDSHKLAVAGSQGVIYWDPQDASAPPVRLDEGDCASVAFSADGRRIAWARNRTIKMRELTSTAPAVVMSTPVRPVGAMTLSANGRWLATADAEQDDVRDEKHASIVRIWDVAAGLGAHVLTADPTSVGAMRFSPDGRQIMTMGSEKVMIWDTATGREMGQDVGTPNSGRRPPNFVMSDDGRRSAYGVDEQSNVYVLDSDSPRRKVPAGGPVNNLVLSGDGRWLAASGCDYTNLTPAGCVMRLWDASTLKEIRHWNENAFNPSVSPDGRYLAAAGGAGRPSLQVWDIASGEQQLSIGTHVFGEMGVVNAIRFSPDSRLVAFSDDRHAIQIWDVAAKKLVTSLVGHTHRVGWIAFDPQGRIISSSRDGTIRLWNAANGRLLVTLVFFEDPKQWLAVTPGGLFDGSPDAWNHLFWRFKGDTFDIAPVDTFFSEFYYPGLLGEVFAGRAPAPPRDIEQLDRRQPIVRLAAVGSDAGAIEARRIAVRVDVQEVRADAAHPGGSGARDVRLFRDGSLVRTWRGDVLASGGGRVTLEASVPIVAGTNRFTAYAFNHDNVKSEDAAMTVTGAPGLARQGTAYVLTVGVNEYANPSFNLKYAVADARRFGEELAQQLRLLGSFGDVQVIPLMDRDATKANILAALKRLAGSEASPDRDAQLPASLQQIKPVEPEDFVAIFFAGHGVTDGARFYMVPHDLGYAGRREAFDKEALKNIAWHGLSDQEIEHALEPVNAGHLLLVIDACNSGQALEAGDRRQRPMNSKGLAQLAYDKGMYILTASQSYQSAIEVERLGHGILTHVLVEDGLAAGAADYAPADGSIFIREWLDFAAERVPELQLDELRQSRNMKLVFVGGEEHLPPEQRSAQRPRVFYRRELESQPFVVGRR